MTIDKKINNIIDLETDSSENGIESSHRRETYVCLNERQISIEKSDSNDNINEEIRELDQDSFSCFRETYLELSPSNYQSESGLRLSVTVNATERPTESDDNWMYRETRGLYENENINHKERCLNDRGCSTCSDYGIREESIKKNGCNDKLNYFSYDNRNDCIQYGLAERQEKQSDKSKFLLNNQKSKFSQDEHGINFYFPTEKELSSEYFALPTLSRSNFQASDIPVSKFLLIAILVLNITTFQSIIFYYSEVSGGIFRIENLPETSILLVASVYVGFLSLIFGIAGDRFINRFTLLRFASFSWIISIILFLCLTYSNVESVILYTLSSITIFFSFSAMFPNLLVLLSISTPNRKISRNNIDWLPRAWYSVQLIGTSLIHIIFTFSRPSKSTKSEFQFIYSWYCIIAVLGLCLNICLFFFLFKTRDMNANQHSSKKNQMYNDNIPRYDETGSILNFKKLNLITYLCGIILLLLGFSFGSASVALSSSTSLFKHHFVCNVASLIFASFGISLVLLSGINIYEKSESIIKTLYKYSWSRDEVHGFLELIVVISVMIFNSFIFSQEYTTFITQLCQTNLKIFLYTFNPEYLAPLVNAVSLISVLPWIYSHSKQRQRTYFHLVLGTLGVMLATFLSGILELYRRNSNLQTRTFEEYQSLSICKKETTDFSSYWALSYIVILGISNMLLNSSILEILFNMIRKQRDSRRSTYAGIFIFSQGIGCNYAISLSMILSDPHEASSQSDLVVALLLITIIGCLCYSAMIKWLKISRTKD